MKSSGFIYGEFGGRLNWIAQGLAVPLLNKRKPPERGLFFPRANLSGTNTGADKRGA
jgi:hypothetical protein